MALKNIYFLAHDGAGLQNKDSTTDLLRSCEHNLEEWRIAGIETVEVNPFYKDNRTAV